MTDDWQMADGFAPVSRLHYCEHPKACSAPERGVCPRCQKRKGWPARKNGSRLGSPHLTLESTPTYVDEDFDTWGAS